MSDHFDLRKLQKHLEESDPASIYIFYGEDSYLREESLDLLKKKIVSEETKDFSLDVYTYGECDIYEVKDSIENLSMMTERKLVIYQGIERIKEKEWQILEPLLDNPVPKCTLALVAYKIDKRKKFFKKASQKGIVVELKSPYESQMASWVLYIAKKLGTEITPEARDLLHQLTGSRLIEIKCQLEKLINFIGDRKVIEEKDVLEVVPRSKIDSIFQLTDSIGNRDRASALTYLANLLSHGESVVAIASMILRHLRILADLEAGQKEGLNRSQLSARSGISPYFLKQYESQLRLWNQINIAQAIEGLHQADRALKSSSLPKHICLENFIILSCS